MPGILEFAPAKFCQRKGSKRRRGRVYSENEAEPLPWGDVDVKPGEADARASAQKTTIVRAELPEGMTLQPQPSFWR